MQWHKSVDGQAWESGGYRVRRHPRSTRWVAAYQPWVNLTHTDGGFVRKVIPGPHESSKAAKDACERHYEAYVTANREPA